MSSIATTAAFSLVLASLPQAAGSSERPESEVAASLMVEVPSDTPDDAALRTRIYDEASRIMAVSKVTQRARLDLPGIVITLARLSGEPVGSSYSIVIRHTPLGDTPLATIGGVCGRTPDEACVQRIGADLALVLPRILADTPPYTRPPATPAPRVGRTPDPELVPHLPPPQARRQLNALSKAGIGILAAGVTGLGVGIGLALNPPKLKADDYSIVITTHTSGYVLIGTGLAAMTAGTAMLIVGLRRSPRVVPMAQTFGGRSLGLGLSGRF